MTERDKILIADPDRCVRGFIKKTVTSHGFIAKDCPDAALIPDLPEAAECFLVFVNPDHPVHDRQTIVSGAIHLPSLPLVVVLTENEDMETAVTFLRNGAFDILPKPFTSNEVSRLVEQAMTVRNLERKNSELETRLSTTEKMAVIGKLAAMVAHELGNPLDGTRRFIDLAAASSPESPDQLEFLAGARAGIRRMEDIVRRLLDLSRNVRPGDRLLPLSTVAAESIEREAREKFSSRGEEEGMFEVILQQPLPEVAVPEGLNQVFFNLIRNARQAAGSRSRGRLVITAQVEDLAVEVLFEDNGPGVPDAIRETIFEPFFTTSGWGSGTGLGLTVCQDILESCEGILTVKKGSEGGALFSIRFPVVHDDSWADGKGSLRATVR